MSPIKAISQASPERDDRYGTVFELAGKGTGLPALGFACVEVDVGAASPLHYHNAMSELYYIVEGSGIMLLDGEEIQVGPGDCVSIKPGLVHGIRNIGAGTLKFFCATGPSYDPDDDIEV